MSTNDVILLEAEIARDRDLSPITLGVPEHHTYFVARQYLKHYWPSEDDLLEGIVDGTHDCGVDGAYIFVNGYCIRDDVPVKGLGRGANLDLILLQAKNTKGFGEDPIDKLIVNLPKLLDFGRDDTKLANFVNARLIEITRRFLTTYQSLEMPRLRVLVCFASLKATQLHPNAKAKGEELAGVIKKCFATAAAEIVFWDAAAIFEACHVRPTTTRSLTLAEIPISTDMTGGYVALVKLNEFERFITAPGGELDSTLFEANVRDYEGDSEVNQSIGHTLEHADQSVDFWWLNNGITIVAGRVQPANKVLELESPQIVNGLQTSTEIYKRKRSDSTLEDRSLLVKIIEAPDPLVRDRIIQATNSQTAFGPSALKATDHVQRQIEKYLLARGLYYERRRRFYFNQGIHQDKLISIDRMGKAVLSTVGQAPHVARASASTIFEHGTYENVFNSSYPVEMFAACFDILTACREYLITLQYAHPVDQEFMYHL